MSAPTVPHGSLRPRPIRTLAVLAPLPPRWGARSGSLVGLINDAAATGIAFDRAARADPPDSGRRAWCRHLAARAWAEWRSLVAAWRRVTEMTFGEDLLS